MITTKFSINKTDGTATKKWLEHTAENLWRSLRRWWQRRQSVTHLGMLSDRQLKDIGIHRSEIHSVVYGTDGSRIRAHDV